MGRIVTLTQGTPEWLQWRNRLIGGSDAPVVEGISPYRTSRELFFEKTGKSVGSDDSSKSYIFALGHKVEGLIREEFQKLVNVDMSPVCMEHEEFGHIGASLDGFDTKLGVLEAKLVGQEVLSNARNGEIPPHHYSQMQHQFAVSGADVGQWFGHDGKKSGVLVEVKASAEYIKRLLDKEHVFWEAVKNGKIPELTEKDFLVPDDDFLLRKLRDAKELVVNAEADLDRIQKLVVETYKHSKISGAGIKLCKVTRTGALDIKKVPEVALAIEDAVRVLKPEYIESFRSKDASYWKLSVGEEK